MQDASMELLVDYYQALLKATTEEELIILKENVKEILKNSKFSDEYIEHFIERADNMVEEGYVFNELEDFLFYGGLADYNQEVETVQEFPSNNTQAIAGGGIGVGLTALIITLALKKKVLNKNNQIKR